MRFSLSTISALLPLTLGAPSSDITSVDTFKALVHRVADPAPIVAPANAGPAGMMMQHFEAWMPMPAYKNSMVSRAYFNMTMMPPVPGWVTMCFTTTKKTLCDPNQWYPCTTYVNNKPVNNEQVMFMLDHDVSSVSIKRTWTYKGTTMTAMASEPAEWNESVNPLVSNVTTSQYGKCYERPNGWKFEWKSMVGGGPQLGV